MSSQPTIIDLGSVVTFATLATTNITNTGITEINGDVGVSPGTAITGFETVMLNGNSYSNTSESSTAIVDAGNAYNDGVGRTGGNGSVSNGVFTPALVNPIPGANITGQDMGGMILPGGVYKFDSSSALTGILELDWNNDPNSVWIFIIESTLTTAISSKVLMANMPLSPPSYLPVFWIVGSSATLGVDSIMNGTILAAVSITINTGAVTGPLIANDGSVTLDTNEVLSYNNQTASGADPHIIALDGSRLDVYDEGFYRMFDSNCDNRIIINTQIIRRDHIDMYEKFLILLSNGNNFQIIFIDDGIKVISNNITTYHSDKWSLKLFEKNNKFYIIEIEYAQRTFFMRTNNISSHVYYRGLLTGEIVKIDSINDFLPLKGNRSFIPNYYKYNALLCASTSPHIVKFNREQLFCNPGTFRLFQDDDIIVNITLDQNRIMRVLKIKEDLFKWVGENHWDLIMYHNDVKVNETPFIKEYLTDNLILRIQNNASLSIALRIITNISGLLCGNIIELESIDDIEIKNFNKYKHTIRYTYKLTSNYSKFIEVI
jgi:hypothetical protein